jgi:hypothetical protein
VRRSGEVWVRRRQRGDFPSEIQPRISSQRKRPPNLFGGGGRGRRGEHFAQGGGRGVRRRQPESPGDGEVIRASQEPECGEKRGEGEGLGWVGLTDPDPSRFGVNQLVGLGWASGPRPTCIFEPNSKFQTLI